MGDPANQPDEKLANLTCILLPLGTFTNYTDQVLPILDHLPDTVQHKILSLQNLASGLIRTFFHETKHYVVKWKFSLVIKNYPKFELSCDVFFI